MAHAQSVAGFDVGFDVDVSPHRITIHHTNRGFRGRGTVPDDMGHDGTALWAQNFKSAALSLFNKDVLNSYLSLTLLLRTG